MKKIKKYRISLLIVCALILNLFTGCASNEVSRGGAWLVDSKSPTVEDEALEGDMYLDTSTYDLYQMIDESWVKIGNIQGKNGINGKDGTNGKDGSNGKDGTNGKDGSNGKDGTNGKDGLDGKDGTDGKDGSNGKDGIDGKDGLDGKDGINGKDGSNGKDGTDGKDGLDGKDGTNGKDGLDGKDGLTPTITIDKDGFWVINGEETNVKAGDHKICEPVDSTTKTTGTIPTGTFKPGDEYICEVKPGTEYHFFVLSKNDKNINLILNANINNKGELITKSETEKISVLNPVDGIYNVIPWISKVDFVSAGGAESDYPSYGNLSKGPVTLLKELEKATKDWKYISNLNETHSDENGKYTNFAITTRVRAPKISELTAIDVGCQVRPSASDTSTVRSCPLWAANFLSNSQKYAGGSNTVMVGYWLLETDGGSAATVNNAGDITGTIADRAAGYVIGMRPVITIKEGNIKD